MVVVGAVAAAVGVMAWTAAAVVAMVVEGVVGAAAAVATASIEKIYSDFCLASNIGTGYITLEKHSIS